MLETQAYSERISTEKSRAILCVDDEPNILQALNRLLRKEGYEIFTATSGEQGLAILAESPGIQVVISDQRMPGMSGSEFLMQVKQHYPDAVRLILSGYAEASAIVEAINEGEISHFLAKPWNDEELKVTVRQCLIHYNLRQENRQLLQKTQAQNDELQRLNNQLADEVSFQARSLQLAQEILDKLPVPVLGISSEGFIALVNEAAGRSPLLKLAFVGEAISENMPAHVVEAIHAVLNDDTSVVKRVPWCLESSENVILRLVSLEVKAGARGCIVLLEEWSV